VKQGTNTDPLAARKSTLVDDPIALREWSARRDRAVAASASRRGGFTAEHHTRISPLPGQDHQRIEPAMQRFDAPAHRGW
jgi:hypothetical protein